MAKASGGGVDTPWTIDHNAAGHSLINLKSWPNAGGFYNVRAYGAAGDGAIDDTIAIQSAIDAANSAGGGTVYFPKPSSGYRVDSTLTLYSNIRLLFEPGAYIDFSNAAIGDTLFEGSGTLGTSTALSADASKGDTTLSVVSEAGFTAGDLIVIHSAGTFAGIPRGEYHYIKSIAAGVLTLEDGLWDNYTTADAATVHKVDAISNIRIEGAWIKGGGAGSNHVGIHIVYGENVRIVGLNSEDMEDRAIQLTGCVNSLVEGITVVRSNLAGYGYGVAVIASQWTRIAHSFFDECRHGVTAGGSSSYYGPTRFIVVTNNHVYGATDAGLDAHAPTQFLIYSHNTVTNKAGDTGADGIIIQGVDAFIANNVIKNPVRHGLFFQPIAGESGSFTIFNNQVYSPGQIGVMFMAYAGSPILNIIAAANIIDSPGTYGIYISTYEVGSEIKQFSITGNSIYSAASKGIYIYAQNADISDGIIANNIIKNSAAENIYLYSASYSITYISIVGNQESGGTYGVRGVATDYCLVDGNVCNGSTITIDVAGANSKISTDNI